MGRCEICGEMMPRGEEMFKYHGSSGPCPKPPLEEIDHESTDNLVCPYCGHEEEDDGEMNERGQTECSKCEKNFAYDVDYSKLFTSRKVDCLNGAPHTWKKEPFGGCPNYKRCKACDFRDYKGIME